jgi:hypothetical protein
MAQLQVPMSGAFSIASSRKVCSQWQHFSAAPKVAMKPWSRNFAGIWGCN